MPALSEEIYTHIVQWLDDAKAAEINDPTAMALATSGADGWPNVRMVLLKSVSLDGFVFYTNKDSQKGVELQANPRASLVFHWKSLRRQIRVKGHVSDVADRDADAYFASRPRQSQIGAILSQQSRPIDSRDAFEADFHALTAEYGDEKPISRPDYWGGYHIDPVSIEFWSDRPYRLHERLTHHWDAADRRWVPGQIYP